MGVIENRIDITELERSGGGGGGGTAASVSYDNTSSGLTATTVQGAIDEVFAGSAGKDQISNRNLLDNGWFTVNQRGKTTYAGTGNLSYTVDRWAYVMNSDSTVKVTNSGVEITIDSGSADNAFAQILENSGRAINGRTATLSAIIDGTLYSGSLETFAPPESRWKVETYFDTDGIKGELARNASGTTQIVIRLPKDGTGHVITAAKLEIGSVSTLDMDTVPNYAEELLKCQRYFVRYKQTNANAMEYGLMVASTATSAHGIVILPVAMRATPSLVVEDATKLSLYGQYKYSLTALSIALCDDQNKVVKLTATTSGMSEGNAYMLQADTGYGFDLSADL